MLETLLLIVAAGLVGPLLASGKAPLLPAVVGELAAGVVLGKTGLNVLDPTTPASAFLRSLGFAMLMLVAGSKVRLDRANLTSGLRTGALAFAICILLAAPLGLGLWWLLAPAAPALLLPILLAGSSAAVAFPILEERGLAGERVAVLLTWIPLADGITVVLVPLTLIGPAALLLAVLGDVAILVVTAALLVLGPRVATTTWATTLRDRSRSRAWALQVRVALVILLVLSVVADRSGGSTLLAGFGAGLVLARLGEPERLDLQLSGLAEGFFVPAFFILLGAQLDLGALVAAPGAVVLAIALAVAAIATHVVAALAVAPGPKWPYGLAASAQLGLPAAAASLGLATGQLSPAVAAAIVAAGCLTMVPASIGTRRLAQALQTGPSELGTASGRAVAP